MDMQSKLPVSIPALFFTVFISIANFVIGLYSGFSIQPSLAFQLVFILIFWAALSWWFLDDSKNHGLEWLHSWGIFLYAAGWLVVPYYLFKTRGAKALLIILALIALTLGSLVSGAVFGAVISALMKR
jgi:hypothetical protein